MLIVAGLIAPTPAEGSSSGDVAQEIVHRMIAASGGMERWNSFRDATFLVRTAIYNLGEGRPYVTVSRLEFTKDPRPMVRVETRANNTLRVQVFDGRESWTSVDGILLHKGKNAYRRIHDAAKSTIFWVTFPFNLVDPAVDVEYLGGTRFMGIDVEVLQVSFRDGSLALHPDDIYRFYINKTTHLVIRGEYFRHGNPEIRMETLYGDYRTVQGLVKDHLREIVSTEAGEKKHRTEIDELRFGVNLSPELFRMPPDPMSLETPLE